jgi:hypothetical protein
MIIMMMIMNYLVCKIAEYYRKSNFTPFNMMLNELIFVI